MRHHRNKTDAVAPEEIAPGVYRLGTGKGFMRSNVYFVRAGSSWALIDAAGPKCAASIQTAAASLFGAETPPASILLTHSHPDHAGSARELARAWRCPVYLHPDELPLTTGDIAVIRQYSNPLDRWMIFPLLRIMPPRKAQAMLAAGSLTDVAAAFDPHAEPPGLPDWQCMHTPGHTPGHVSFFRPGDRVLITGDAIVTLKLNSLSGLLFRKPGLSGPPRYATWNWQAAKASAAALATLEPRVLAGGHGTPITGPTTARDLHAFAEQFSTQS